MGAATLFVAGCATDVPVRAKAYDIQVQLDPERHFMSGKTTLDLVVDTPKKHGRHFAAEFALNKALTVKKISAEGARVGRHRMRPAPVVHEETDDDEAEEKEEKESLIEIHQVEINADSDSFRLTFEYAGPLVQDVAAGEKAGEIHNFMMAAHVSPEGIYLDSGGGWYPSPYRGEDDHTGELATYRLTTAPVPGMMLVAGAAPVEASVDRLVWESRIPTEGMVLVGGRHVKKEREVIGVDVGIEYTPQEEEPARALIEKNTDLFLDAAEEYLTRYVPLVGPYPYADFTIVENFFSSGFAFPHFTLLNKVLLQMGPRALKHGYLDHEMLHSWWGNSIYVDPAGGNWCEGLASYGANYYGYVLDGDMEGARKQRRNCCNFLSRIKPKNDKPLDTFGQKDGAGRSIGYSKGTMVFHMISRRIGQECFWEAMRRMTAEYTGKYANWHTLQRLFEEVSGQDLDRFFHEWVRTGGAPSLSLADAVWQGDGTLAVTLDQGGTAFELDVPLRVVGANGESHDKEVRIDEAVQTVTLSLDARPTSVVLDPGYDVFRKLQPAEIMPTTATTRSAKKLLVVKPAEEISPFYQRVIDAFRGDEPDKDREVMVRAVDELQDGELASSSVLLLGDAVKDPRVQALLARTNCPISWDDSGFAIDGERYDGAGKSVLCTVHHPDIPDGGMTIYYGNSETALGRSDLLLFYGNSLVAWNTMASEVDGQTKYESSVVARKDFESVASIEVRDE